MRSSQQRAAAGFLAGTALGVLYAFPPDRYPFYPACPFYSFTGLLCPGCGATRALAALLHGHFAEAFAYNALVVSLLPLLLAYAVFYFWQDRQLPAPRLAVAALCVACGVFTLLRNLA